MVAVNVFFHPRYSAQNLSLRWDTSIDFLADAAEMIHSILGIDMPRLRAISDTILLYGNHPDWVPDLLLENLKSRVDVIQRHSVRD